MTKVDNQGFEYEFIKFIFNRHGQPMASQWGSNPRSISEARPKSDQKKSKKDANKK